MYRNISSIRKLSCFCVDMYVTYCCYASLCTRTRILRKCFPSLHPTTPSQSQLYPSILMVPSNMRIKFATLSSFPHCPGSKPSGLCSFFNAEKEPIGLNCTFKDCCCKDLICCILKLSLVPQTAVFTCPAQVFS